MKGNSKSTYKSNDRKKRITKSALKKFVKQNKPTRFIAGYLGVSERTVYRRIKQYGLKGVRPHGRKPFLVKPKPIKRIRKWITVKKYIDDLHERYRIYNIQYPKTRYVNPKTLVCSNEKRNPKGLFTTVGVYWIALHSDIHFIYRTGFRYKLESVSFKEICDWISENALDMLTTLMMNTGIFVEQVVAFTFHTGKEKLENNERT